MDVRKHIRPYGAGWERQRELLTEAEQLRLVRDVKASRWQGDPTVQETIREIWRISLGGWTLIVWRMLLGLGRG